MKFRDEQKHNYIKNLIQIHISTKTNQIVDIIKHVVAQHYNVPVDIFSNRSRIGDVVKIKHYAVYLCRINLERPSLAEIGSYFVGRKGYLDHASVMHVEKKINDYLSFDKELQIELQGLQNTIVSKCSFLDGKPNIDENEIYYINMDSLTSLKLENGKAVLFAGMDEDEITSTNLLNLISKIPMKKHENTGQYIFERIS